MRSVIEFVLAIVITVVVILLIGLFLPGGGHGHVERSIIIERPPSHVFDVLNSYKRFNEWSPYAKKDTSATYTFEGPEAGQGAVMKWSGNEAIGSGRWEIIESTPTSIVKMIQNVDGGRVGTVTFNIGTTDLGVKVTWTYDVELGSNPIERIKGLYLDSSVGADYPYGLMRLKAMIESSAYARDYSDITITKQQLVPGPALKLAGLVEVYSSSEFPDLNAGVVDTLKKLQAFVDRNKLTATGPAQVLVTLKSVIASPSTWCSRWTATTSRCVMTSRPCRAWVARCWWPSTSVSVARAIRPSRSCRPMPPCTVWCSTRRPRRSKNSCRIARRRRWSAPTPQRRLPARRPLRSTRLRRPKTASRPSR